MNDNAQAVRPVDERGSQPSPAASRARRPRHTTAARREEILRAAVRTFGSKGYHNGSLVEVAEQVGMTHAGVLHHFGSKVGLLWAVLEYRDQVDVEHLQGRHPPGGLELFRHLVRTAAINVDRRGLVQTYSVLTGEAVTDGHPARDWVRDRFILLRNDIVDALRTVIREQATARTGTRTAGDSGDPALHDPASGDQALSRAASSIIAVMDGLQTQWLLDPTAVDLAEASAFAIEAILAAVVAGGAMPRPLTGDV